MTGAYCDVHRYRNVPLGAPSLVELPSQQNGGKTTLQPLSRSYTPQTENEDWVPADSRS